MTFKTRRQSQKLLMALMVIALSFSAPFVHAETSAEIKEKIENAKEAADKTKSAIEDNQEEVDSLNEAKETLSEYIESMNDQLVEINEEINSLDDQISQKQDEIDVIKKDLALAQGDLDLAEQNLDEAVADQEKQYEAMKRRIQFLYEKGDASLIEVFFDSKSFSDFLNKKDYIEALSKYDAEALEKYEKVSEEVKEDQTIAKTKRNNFQKQKASLEKEQDEIENLKSEQIKKRKKVALLISDTSEDVKYADEQIKEAEAITEAMQKKLDEQNKDIKELQAQLAKEQQLQAKSDAGTWRNVSDITFADGDRKLLANIIFCEAGNQPYEGQVAVGAVIINRMLSSAFPNTLSGVVYQSWQFTPAMTGRLALALTRNEATDSCYKAADAAMAGQTTVGNCLFFRTPIDGINYKYKISGHIFY